MVDAIADSSIGMAFDSGDIVSGLSIEFIALSEILKSDLTSKINEMRTKNELLKESNAMLNRLRDLKSAEATSVPDDVKAFFAKMGLTVTESDLNSKEGDSGWDSNIEKLKTKNDSLSTNSQLDMIQLQSTMGRYNQTFESISNIFSKSHQNMQTLIGNLR